MSFAISSTGNFSNNSNASNFSVTGQVCDLLNGIVFPGKVTIAGERIVRVEKLKSAPDRLLAPGFIDSHIHIESSLLVPAEFARLAVIHGTIGCLADPHEIANVVGVNGVNFMIDNGKSVPFYFGWGVPSCVPATPFERAGAVLGVPEVSKLLESDDILFLAEMMNYPGVIQGDEVVNGKLNAAKRLGKPIDGHAPGLRGRQLQNYIQAGISTDHESTTFDEALEKIELGMKILIREGSAAKNFTDLQPLLKIHPERCMFASDDLHAGDLLKGHINLLAKRALDAGVPLIDVLRCASLNPKKHYGLRCGMLQVGDYADFIVITNEKDFEIEATFIKGEKVASEGRSRIGTQKCCQINNFCCDRLTEFDLQVRRETPEMRVIKLVPGQLLTEEKVVAVASEDKYVATDVDNDVLKLVVYNRYLPKSKPAVAFVQGFGLKRGAFASSVAHDSHNIIAVGVADDDLCRAIDCVINARGGLAVVEGKESLVLPLPIAGLMSDEKGDVVSRVEHDLHAALTELGVSIGSPFTLLSFLALTVIPQLKLSDQGLFDVDRFAFVPLFV